MESKGKEKSKRQLSDNLKMIQSLTDRHLADAYKNLCACSSFMLRYSDLLGEDLVAALEAAREDLEKNLAKHTSTIEIEESANHKKRAMLIYDIVSNVLNRMATKDLEYFVTECKEGSIAECNPEEVVFQS